MEDAHEFQRPPERGARESLKYKRSAAQLCYLLGPSFAQWSFTKTALRRLTPYQISHWLSDTMAARWGRESVVWDAFANIGSDAEKFAQSMSQVICSESAHISDALADNLRAFGHENARLEREIDISRTETWPKADIAYLNPPWGTMYDRINRDCFDISKISIGEQSFATVFQRARKRYHVVVVVPSKGVDFAELYASDFTCAFAQLTFHFYDKD